MKCAHLESENNGKDTWFILWMLEVFQKNKHIHRKVKCAHLVPEPDSR